MKKSQIEEAERRDTTNVAKIMLMMAELQEIQNQYENGTAPFRWINNCFFDLDVAKHAIAILSEKITDE
jgi:hypothetical protein